mmetsp:Transcript_615/g.554  ORF Transcript_615/g.554 Transcript_615/m.554 type:complete len:101 (+) Transcript_615:542-844(+)
MNEKNNEEINKLLKELERYPEDRQRIMNLAKKYSEKNDLDNALEYGMKALNIMNDGGDTVFVAELWKKKQRRDKANEILLKAHEKFPRHASVLYNLTWIA